MPALFTRGDCLREYLTGAVADGAAQPSVILSLGGHRSSSEIMSYGMQIDSALSSITVDFASGGCATGTGILNAIDADHVTWQDALATFPGDPLYLPGIGSQGIVESGGNPSSFLRITRTSSSAIFGSAGISLTPRRNNFYGLDQVTPIEQSAGVSEYVGGIVRNESVGNVQAISKYISLLAQTMTCNTGLGASGSGTITTTGSFSSWPTSGWCRISAGGSLKEVVYYSSRTDTVLTVNATGRGLLGTTPAIGAGSDILDNVPGIAVAVDPSGAQVWGSAIQALSDINTPPVGVTWKLGLDPSTGANLGTLAPNQQVGFWLWRQIPAGAVATPYALNSLGQSFMAF